MGYNMANITMNNLKQKKITSMKDICSVLTILALSSIAFVGCTYDDDYFNARNRMRYYSSPSYLTHTYSMPRVSPIVSSPAVSIPSATSSPLPLSTSSTLSRTTSF